MSAEYSNTCRDAHALEDVFCKSDILYLVDNNNEINDLTGIVSSLQRFVGEYQSHENVPHDALKDTCLALWLYCMHDDDDDDATTNSLAAVDRNCDALYQRMVKHQNAHLLMQLLKMSLSQHKKSIDELLENNLGMIAFDDVYQPPSSDTPLITAFWSSFEILNLCMNSVLCIAFSQRNQPHIVNNALFIEHFHIDGEPLFVHLFNFIAQDNYAERMPLKKFLIYIKWHLFLTSKMDQTLNAVTERVKQLSTSSATTRKKKSRAFDFFQIASEVNTFTPLLVLPPSSAQMEKAGNERRNVLQNASTKLTNKISELFAADADDEDEKYASDSDKVEYVKPARIDWRYPIHLLPEQFQFEAAEPRIELFGKFLVPAEKLSLLEDCHQALPNHATRRYNLYACDVYKYLAIKARVPAWVLLPQTERPRAVDNSADAAPKWLQNIRFGLSLKTLVKVLCSSMQYAYKRRPTVQLAVPTLPDVRYEMLASPFCRQQNTHYINELQRHQHILASAITAIFLCLLKLFKTHETMQFEYLRYTLQKNSLIVVLSKLFNHPCFMNDADFDQLSVMQPQTWKHYDASQLMRVIFTADHPRTVHTTADMSSATAHAQILSTKINALRIIQKCVKNSFGHCRALSTMLQCHRWLLAYTQHSNGVLRYYAHKLYKSMMPFVNESWRQESASTTVIEWIGDNLAIGVNDQWLSHSIAVEFEATLKRYNEKANESQRVSRHPYYEWLGLESPTERDYAEEELNPFFVGHRYGDPEMELMPLAKWSQLLDDACTDYHEWLLKQMKAENVEFEKQKKFIGMTRKDKRLHQAMDRGDRIDGGLAKIKIPRDFDYTAYLKAYFNGKGDILRTICM